MSEENNDSGNQTQNTGYSAEYVKELRDEAASYRTKARDANDELTTLKGIITADKTAGTINAEFTKRGIKADPKWVTLDEGQDASKAVDKFLKDYPQFSTPQAQPPVIPGRAPMSPQRTNTNIENNAVSELGAIKNDPIARAQLRDQYRNLLANQANTNFTV